MAQNDKIIREYLEMEDILRTGKVPNPDSRSSSFEYCAEQITKNEDLLAMYMKDIAEVIDELDRVDVGRYNGKVALLFNADDIYQPKSKEISKEITNIFSEFQRQVEHMYTEINACPLSQTAKLEKLLILRGHCNRYQDNLDNYRRGEFSLSTRLKADRDCFSALNADKQLIEFKANSGVNQQQVNLGKEKSPNAGIFSRFRQQVLNIQSAITGKQANSSDDSTSNPSPKK